MLGQLLKVGCLFMLPAVSLLGLAGLWRNWRVGWLIQPALIVGIAAVIVALK